MGIVGSELQTSLDFEWSKRGWVANGPDFEWDLKSESPAILNPDKWQTFVKNHLKSRQKHPDFKWSGFQMVVTIAIAIVKAQPFEIRPSKSPFHMVGFQIPTVFGFLFCFDDYLYILLLSTIKIVSNHISHILVTSLLKHLSYVIIAHIFMTSFRHFSNRVRTTASGI